MRSPRRGDRMEDPLQRPGGPRHLLSSKTRVISSRHQRELGLRNSSRATFDQKRSRLQDRKKMLPPKDRNRPAVEDRSRSTGSPVKDLREKLISKKKDVDKDETNVEHKRDEEVDAKRGAALKRARNEKSQEEEREESTKKRSPVRIASPIDEPSVTSTVQNSELELDYEYESLNEEVDTPERAVSPERPKCQKVDRKELNQSFTDDKVEKMESSSKTKAKKEDTPKKENMEKGNRENGSPSRDGAVDKRSSSPYKKKQIVSSRCAKQRRSSSPKSVQKKEPITRHGIARNRVPRPFDRQLRGQELPPRAHGRYEGNRGSLDGEMRHPRFQRGYETEKFPRGIVRSRTPSLSPLRKIVGKDLIRRKIPQPLLARNRPGKVPFVGGKHPRDRSPLRGPRRDHSPRQRQRFSPPRIPSLLDMKLAHLPRRISPGRRISPRRVSPGRRITPERRFSPQMHRRVSPIRLSPPLRMSSERIRRMSNDGFDTFRDDRPEWREIRQRDMPRGRLPPVNHERFRDLSPRLEGRQFTPEWDRRRSPSRFDGPDQRFVEPIERYPDGSRMLPLHPSERRFVQTAGMSPEPEWRGRYLSPRREFREMYTDQRCFSPPAPRSFPPMPPIARGRSRSMSPRHRKRSPPVKRIISKNPKRSRTPSRHIQRSKSRGERSLSRSEKLSKKKGAGVKEKKKNKDRDINKAERIKSKEKKAPKKIKSSKMKPKKINKKKDELKKKKKKVKKEESSSESSTSESGSLSESDSTSTSETTSSSEEDEALRTKKKMKKGDKKNVTPPKTADSEALSVEKELEIEERPGSLIIDKPTEEVAESESEESTSQVEQREQTLPVFFNRVGLETAVGSDVKISHLDVLTITRSCKENNLVHWREKESSTPLSDRFARYSRLNPVARPGILEEPIVLKVNMNADRPRRQAPLDLVSDRSSSSAPVIPAPVIPPNWEDPKVRLTYYTTLGFLPKNATYEDMRAYERQRVGHVPNESRLRNHSESEDEYSLNASRGEGSYRKKDKRKGDGTTYEEKKKKYV